MWDHLHLPGSRDVIGHRQPFDPQVVISYRCSIGTKSVSPAVFQLLVPNYFGHDLDLSGSRHVIVMWPFCHVTIWFLGSHFISVLHSVHWHQVRISSRCWDNWPQIWGATSQIIWVMTLTFLGHVTSSVTWPFESQWAISYWWSIGTKCVSPAVLEIMGPKHIGVTTLTFQGHVTSSVHWIQVSISNRFRDIVSQTSCAHRHDAKSSVRMHDIMWHDM